MSVIVLSSHLTFEPSVRQHLGAFSCAGMFGVQRTDTVYSSLPLYHSSGSTLGISMALCFGVKTVVKKKFSARSFFQDCAKYNATVGELLPCE